MPGVTDAILAFLTLLNKSGLPEQYKEAYDKRSVEDKKLHENAMGMKDAPPPNTGGSHG